MFVDFTKGHWLSVYRGRLPGDMPPATMRMMTAERPAGVILPDDMANYPGHSGKFMLKLLAGVDGDGVQAAGRRWRGSVEGSRRRKNRRPSRAPVLRLGLNQWQLPKPSKLPLYDGSQAREIFLHGDPNAALQDILIVMPIDASRAGDIGPWNFRNAAP